MGGVVHNLDKVMATMDLEKVLILFCTVFHKYRDFFVDGKFLSGNKNDEN